MNFRCWYRLENHIYGPVSFNDLAHMVREAEIDSEDWVQADGQENWCRASDLLGIVYLSQAASGTQSKHELLRLFNEAGEDLSDPKYSTQEASLNPKGHRDSEIDMMLEGLESSDTGSEFYISNKSSQLFENKNDNPHLLERIRGHIRDVIEDAISDQDSKCERSEKASKRKKILSRLFSKSSLRTAYRWGVAMLFACMIGWSITEWSEYQSLRYPDPKMQKLGGRSFPLWGWCSQDEYLLLISNTIIGGGILGYFLAATLESMAED